MARCASGCGFTNEVHDLGCVQRAAGYRSAELNELYATETAAEHHLLNAALALALITADLAGDYDEDDVAGGEDEWLALRRAVRAGLPVAEVAGLVQLRNIGWPELMLVTPT